MASVQSRILLLYLKLARRKRPYTDPRIFRARIEEERKTVDHAPPATLRDRFEIDQRTIEGAPCYVLSCSSSKRKTKKETRRRHVLYLHGGCYVFEITSHHWMFCAWLAETLDVNVTIPIYPLAPEHNVEAALRMVTATYRSIAASDEIILMGDSAGGGMALALAQVEKRGESGELKHIVLLSPWLDATMSHPEIPAADARDPWLSRPGLVEAGVMYAGDAIDPKDPRVSPLHGALDSDKLGGAAAISIFIGTRDVLLPDARLLATRAKGARIFEYEEMVHDFMLIDFLPEAKRARADIVSVLRVK